MTVGAQIVGKATRPGVGYSVRRWSSTCLNLLAIVGVPITAFILTGGLSALGFWIEVVLVLAVSIIFGGFPYWFVGIIPLLIVVAVLEKLFPRRGESIGTILPGLLWVVLGVISFFDIPLDDSGVRLPADPPQLGALIVMGASLVTSSALLYAGSRLEPAPPRVSPSARPPTPSSYPAPPEPEGEFWSPQPVIAWRAWQWTGSALRGMVTEWAGLEFEASCGECDEPPGWDHPCGVYAVASPSSLPEFFRADVIGRVELSGLVIEHEIGFRASHARILEVWTEAAVARHLADAYPGLEIHIGAPHTWPT
jgi:hypothetical protein